MRRLVPAAVAASLLVSLVHGAGAAGVVVVHPADLRVWEIADTGTAHGSFVNGPGLPPFGTASFRQTVTQGQDVAGVQTAAANGARLDALTTLAYSTYTVGNRVQAPYVTLYADLDGDGRFTRALDDILFFEPVYQSGTYATVPGAGPVPNQCPGVPGCVAPGTWQRWDVSAGGWWSIRGGTGGPPLDTLAHYAQAHPGVRLITEGLVPALRIQSGGGPGSWDDFDGAFDGFRIDDTTYDFELVAPTPPAVTPTPTPAPPSPPTVEVDDGGDGRITQFDSRSVRISGSRPADTSVRVHVADIFDDTLDATLITPPGTGPWSVTADLSGLGLGRLVASAVAIGPGGTSAPATDTTRKVPDDYLSSPVAPRVNVRDSDGISSPREEDLQAVPVEVTHLDDRGPGDVTLTLSDGTTTVGVALPSPLPLDTPTRVVADLRAMRDGTVTARGTLQSAPPVAGTDTTILDRAAPRSSFDPAILPACVILPVLGLTTCSLEGTTTDDQTAVVLVYVTGRNETQGGVIARHAALETPGSRTTRWRVAGASLATLSAGMWTFEARAQDAAGHFEAAGAARMQLLVL